jgi:threonyl-tRNA synthetase
VLKVVLPDGSKREFDQAVSVMDVAMSIGEGLARATLAGVIDGQLVDASTLIEKDVSLRLITSRDEEGLEVIRHSTAHLLAQAVKQLHPSAQVTIGPVIEDGFYYDFSLEKQFTPDDLKEIESKMKSLVKAKQPITRKVLPRDEAVEYFKSINEHYKAEIIASIPEGEDVSLYTQGDFTDLCRGPHVPHTGHLKVFKLMKLAGAYWRGNSDNEMLQRVYGTAWSDKKDLKSYLYRFEEAAKRDHRKIGKVQNLFHLRKKNF